MGKSGKQQRNQLKPPHRRRSFRCAQLGEEEDSYPNNNIERDPLDSSTGSIDVVEDDVDDDVGCGKDEGENAESSLADIPSKFILYQQSVQLPKGDISYMLKFFMMYVGGRLPFHLQEDFCGTAFLSTEWLSRDARRTAVGLDLDIEALNWCLENNVKKAGADVFSRIFLFHGNVLQPFGATLINLGPEDLTRNIRLKGIVNVSEKGLLQICPSVSDNNCLEDNISLPARDIVCAFNYSCCCIQRRGDLIIYFKHVLDALSKSGGIFVMDLYGGTSSECNLKLQKRFPNFMYVWEQDDFDIIQRRTRISLHYHLQQPRKRLRHAFTYTWRLWSLPEIKDCMGDAGFQSVHFWIRGMPDTEPGRITEGFGCGREVKYEEVSSFQQQGAWNAYIVGVVN